MDSRLRTPLIVGAAGLAACVLVYTVNPSEPGTYPPCPTKLLTGLDCPFCGSLRATHEVMHGNVAGALDLNAVTVLFVLPALLVLYALWLYRSWRGEEFVVRIPTWAMSTLVVFMLVFTVVRNLPGMYLGTSA